MKLNHEVIFAAPSVLNAIGDRELDLRGLNIPEIENLYLTKDQHDTIDFANNEIRRLENFPPMKRLKYIIASNNRIFRIENDLYRYLPNINTIILINNDIEELGDLDPFGQFQSLEHLSLMDNPVTSKKYYRQYLIYQCKKLRVLDFKRISAKERNEAEAKFSSAEGQELAKSLSSSKGAKTFEPGLVEEEEKTTGLSPDEVARIKAAIAKASSYEEVKMLEKQLLAGHIPGAAKSK